MTRLWTTSLAALCLTVAACRDVPTYVPDTPPATELAAERGGRGGPKGDPGPVIDEFDTLEPARWISGNHALGRGWLHPANVSHADGRVLLTLPPGTWDGAEIQSVERHDYGVFEARMKTPLAPGSISAFFLYEFRRRQNEEIDIEIFNDGSGRALFATWVRGRQTNLLNVDLGFDPSQGFHDYRIEWGRDRVRFLVDGVLRGEWSEGVPRGSLHVMANHWWPTWLTGPQPDASAHLEIDRITY